MTVAVHPGAESSASLVVSLLLFAVVAVAAAEAPRRRLVEALLRPRPAVASVVAPPEVVPRVVPPMLLPLLRAAGLLLVGRLSVSLRPASL